MVSIWYHRVMAMTVRLTPSDDELLEKLAELEQVSKQEAIVRAIRDRAQRRLHQQRVAEVSDSIISRYGDVLEALAKQ